MKILESDVKAAIRRYIKTVPKCKMVSYNPYPTGEPGTPDFIGSWGGRSFLIEVKAPGKKLSPIQRIRRQEWEATGALVLVADNVNIVKEVIK